MIPTNLNERVQARRRALMSDDTMKVLDAMATLLNRSEFGKDGALNFMPIVSATKLDRAVVRRKVRFLARRQMAEFQKGLWTVDGEPVGSGYGLTALGWEIAVDNGTLPP